MVLPVYTVIAAELFPVGLAPLPVLFGYFLGVPAAVSSLVLPVLRCRRLSLLGIGSPGEAALLHQLHLFGVLFPPLSCVFTVLLLVAAAVLAVVFPSVCHITGSLRLPLPPISGRCNWLYRHCTWCFSWLFLAAQVFSARP